MKKENDLAAGISQTTLVNEFMTNLVHPLHDTIQYLRSVILKTDKAIGEGIFWNAPTFYYTGNMQPFNPKEYRRYIVGFNFFKQDSIRLIFLRGADVVDSGGLLTGDYKDSRRIASFSSMEEVKKSEATLKKIIQQLLRQIDK